MKETTAKYLAGLCDADASLSFLHANENALALEFQLCASEAVDRDGRTIKALVDELGLGYVSSRISSGNTQNFFRVGARSELERFLPHIIKHMVIKGQHWSWLLEVYRRMKGQAVSLELMDQLRAASKASRAKAGSLRHKMHPTWGWTAGYLDGDGSYKFRSARNQKGVEWRDMSIGCISHENDRAGIDLLFKAFGGSVYKVADKPHIVWYRNLGTRDRSFALTFLAKMAGRSRLKRWKIEQMISHHKQRLTLPTATAEVIV